jgi:hypothetical protein
MAPTTFKIPEKGYSFASALATLQASIAKEPMNYETEILTLKATVAALERDVALLQSLFLRQEHEKESRRTETARVSVPWTRELDAELAKDWILNPDIIALSTKYGHSAAALESRLVALNLLADPRYYTPVDPSKIVSPVKWPANNSHAKSVGAANLAALKRRVVKSKKEDPKADAPKPDEPAT